MDNQLAVRVHVIKRNKNIEQFEIGKLVHSIQMMAREKEFFVNSAFRRLGDITSRFERIIRRSRIISTEDLSKRFAQFLMHYQIRHYNFAKLAREVELNNLHKTTCKSFVELIKKLYTNKKTGPLISEKVISTVKKFGNEIDAMINYENDHKYTYFGLKILQKSYLWKIDNKVVERPQQMLMRVAVAIFPNDLRLIGYIYRSLKDHYFVPSAQILKNAGLKKPYYQNSFVLTIRPGEIGLMEFFSRFAECLKLSGDIGIDLSQTIGKGMNIPGTDNRSKGVFHLVRIIEKQFRNITKKYQTAGSVAFYLEIWHKDIWDFINLNGFKFGEKFSYNIVIPDEFMKRMEKGSEWFFCCPSKCPNLWNVHGEEFDALYHDYFTFYQHHSCLENASILWELIMYYQYETGGPGIVFKDTINDPLRTGLPKFTINASNKYANMALFASESYIASAYSAYLILPTFIDNGIINTTEFRFHIDVAVRFLDKVIDESSYQTFGSHRYAHYYRPLSLGVHGLADLYHKTKSDFSKDVAKNCAIFENIYLDSLSTSVACAMRNGSCKAFETSQYFLTGETSLYKAIEDRYGIKSNQSHLWENLHSILQRYRIKNSAFISLKSDTITSQIMGVSNSVYPYYSLVHRVEGLQDNLLIINEEFMRLLITKNLWNEQTRRKVIQNHNRINSLVFLPKFYKNIFQTASEMNPNEIINLAKFRAPFVDQSESLKVYLNIFDYKNEHRTYLLDIWKNKLKTLYKIIKPFQQIPSIKLFSNIDPLDSKFRSTDPKENQINLDKLYIVRTPA